MEIHLPDTLSYVQAIERLEKQKQLLILNLEMYCIRRALHELETFQGDSERFRTSYCQALCGIIKALERYGGQRATIRYCKYNEEMKTVDYFTKSDVIRHKDELTSEKACVEELIAKYDKVEECKDDFGDGWEPDYRDDGAVWG